MALIRLKLLGYFCTFISWGLLHSCIDDNELSNDKIQFILGLKHSALIKIAQINDDRIFLCKSQYAWSIK